MCVFLCKDMCTEVQVLQEARDVRVLTVGDSGGCELPDVGAWN